MFENTKKKIMKERMRQKRSEKKWRSSKIWLFKRFQLLLVNYCGTSLLHDWMSSLVIFIKSLFIIRQGFRLLNRDDWSSWQLWRNCYCLWFRENELVGILVLNINYFRFVNKRFRYREISLTKGFVNKMFR